MNIAKIEYEGTTIGDKIEAIANNLLKSQVGFFMVEQILKKMTESTGSLVYLNRLGVNTLISETDGYKKHSAKWDEAIANMKKDG